MAGAVLCPDPKTNRPFHSPTARRRGSSDPIFTRDRPLSPFIAPGAPQQRKDFRRSYSIMPRFVKTFPSKSEKKPTVAFLHPSYRIIDGSGGISSRPRDKRSKKSTESPLTNGFPRSDESTCRWCNNPLLALPEPAHSRPPPSRSVAEPSQVVPRGWTEDPTEPTSPRPLSGGTPPEHSRGVVRERHESALPEWIFLAF